MLREIARQRKPNAYPVICGALLTGCVWLSVIGFSLKPIQIEQAKTLGDSARVEAFLNAENKLRKSEIEALKTEAEAERKWWRLVFEMLYNDETRINPGHRAKIKAAVDSRR